MTKCKSLYFAGPDWTLHADELETQFLQDLLACGAGGQDATPAVEHVIATYEITGCREDCATMLRALGAWEENELQDHDENLRRLIWLTGCALREDDRMAYFSTY